MIETDINKPQAYIGWDIGGAYLKVARLSSDGSVEVARQIACPLWKGIGELERAYRLASEIVPTAATSHIVTMTGELADSFETREQGVRDILNTMRDLLKQDFWVYTSNGLCNDREALIISHSVASQNWRAIAEWLADQLKEGVLIDMGSTTTDIVPFKSGRIAVQGYDDLTRMQYGELVYSGISRTPIMAIADHFEMAKVKRPIVAEHFATTADVYRILGKLEEDSDLYPTCDSADKTIEASARRLDRMFGLDWNGDLATTRIKAQAIASTQQQKIKKALEVLLKRTQLSDACIIGAGAGYKIVQCIAESLGLQFMPYHRLLNNLPEHLEDIVCCCATAMSVAGLAQQKGI